MIQQASYDVILRDSVSGEDLTTWTVPHWHRFKYAECLIVLGRKYRAIESDQEGDDYILYVDEGWD